MAITSTETAHRAAVIPVETKNPRRWLILVVLVQSLIIISLDNTVLNVALPEMQRDLSATADELQWVVDGYMLAFAALLLLAGNLSDRFGRKPALQFGLLVFAGGSTLAIFSDTTNMVLIARVVMGIGGAFIMPATLSIVTTVFTGPERAKAIGIWTACAGIGVAIGPILGGLLLEHYWWGSVFLINLPIAGLALIAGHFLIPNSRDPGAGPPDLWGAVLSSIGFVALVYGIISAPSAGWTSTEVLGSLAVGAVFLGAFVAVELRVRHPMLPMWLFSDRRFSTACVSIGLMFFALYGCLYLLTQYLQVVREYSSLEAGLRTLPVAIGLALTAPQGPGLAAKFGAKRVVAIGMMVSAAGLGTFTLLGTDTDYWLAVGSLVVLGIGMGATMGPATESVMSAVPTTKAGIGSAVNDMVRQLGGALGVAVLGSVLADRYANQVRPTVESLTEIPPGLASVATDSVGGAHAIATASPPGVREVLQAAADNAFVSAIQTAVIIGSAVIVFGAIMVVAFLPSGQFPPAVEPPRRPGPRHAAVTRRGPRHAARQL